MEYTPGAYERFERWVDAIKVSEMLQRLLELKYTILHIQDDIARRSHLEANWTGQIGQIEEVTQENVRHDLADAQLLQSRTLGCARPMQLQELNA